MGALTVTIAAATPALEEEWRALESRADRSFFLSWTFVSTALALAVDGLLAARISDGAELVGLCLLWPVVETRHGILRVRQLRLNEYGADADDSVPSEYTAVLATRGYEDRAWAALFDALRRRDDWDELVVTNLLQSDEPRLAAAGLRLHRRAESGSGFVDLASLRARGVSDLDGYVATLGKSTRSAITRSMKLYAERGALRLERAGCAQLAIDWFGEIAKLQTEKWRARGCKGVNDRTFLKAFDERLIAKAAPVGAVEVLRVSAADDAFAWLCNFVDRDKALFYIGGFRTEDDNRLKPGLVAHAMAIADHLQAGRAVYDFMAGDDRYKTNLGEAGPQFISVAAQRPRLMLRLEDALRALKHRLERGDSGGAA